MSKIIEQLDNETIGDNRMPRFRAGETVRVSVRIKEGSKERIQIFEGVVIASHVAGVASTLTVRKISYGVGVERIFPIYSPTIEKIEWLRRGRVRRAKLYYLRDLRGKKARLDEVHKAKAPSAN